MRCRDEKKGSGLVGGLQLIGWLRREGNSFKMHQCPASKAEIRERGWHNGNGQIQSSPDPQSHDTNENTMQCMVGYGGGSWLVNLVLLVLDSYHSTSPSTDSTHPRGSSSPSPSICLWLCG